jgi:hypothetical protein
MDIEIKLAAEFTVNIKAIVVRGKSSFSRRYIVKNGHTILDPAALISMPPKSSQN